MNSEYMSNVITFFETNLVYIIMIVIIILGILVYIKMNGIILTEAAAPSSAAPVKKATQVVINDNDNKYYKN